MRCKEKEKRYFFISILVYSICLYLPHFHSLQIQNKRNFYRNKISRLHSRSLHSMLIGKQEKMRNYLKKGKKKN